MRSHIRCTPEWTRCPANRPETLSGHPIGFPTPTPLNIARYALSPCELQPIDFWKVLARHPAIAGPRTGQDCLWKSNAFPQASSRRRLRRPPALTGWKSARSAHPWYHRPNNQLSLTIGARPVALRAAAFSRPCGCRIVANAPARRRRRHPRTPPDAPLAGTPVGLDTRCNSSGPDCRAATGLRPQSGARPLELHPSVSSGGRRSRRREGALSQRLMMPICVPIFH